MVLGSSTDSQARVGFVGLQQGSLSVSEYEIFFLKWARHTPTLFSTEQDLSQRLIRGLTYHFI